MNTIAYLCGCFISRSMFGNREIMGIGLCIKHAAVNQAELAIIAERLGPTLTAPPDKAPDGVSA